MKSEKVREILDQFLRDMENSRKSRNTIVNYRSDLQYFLNNCPENIDNVTVETLRAHFDGLNCKSPTTKARHMSSLKSFLNWCYKKDFINDNPILKIDREKTRAPLSPKKVEKNEVERVINSIQISNENGSINKNNLKYKLIFLLMLEAGLKIHEVLNLDSKNIEIETQTIFINTAVKRRIPLFSSESINLFRLYAYEANISSGLIFKGGDTEDKSLSYQALNKFWRKCRKKLNSDIKLHQIRDCYANELIKSGINISIISKMLGHKNIQTTVKYLQ